MSTHKNHNIELIKKLKDELKENSKWAIMLHQTIADTLKLNITDHKCLDFISQHDGVTAGQLTEFTGLTGGAVTALIDRLEKSGYVVRERDLKDRRKLVIRAVAINNSEKGSLNQVTDVFSAMNERMDKQFSKYNEEELKLILSFISELNSESSEIIKELSHVE